MNKCDFCMHGPCENVDYCYYRGTSYCDSAIESYMKILLNRNKRTTTHNKNINVRRNGSKKR